MNSKKAHIILTWAWAVQIPLVILLYFFFPGFWEKVSILYLAIVSIYANAVGHASAVEAGKAVELAEEAKEST